MKDKLLTIAIVIAIFCPIILFFFTSWFYALIIGNIFYSIICGWYLKTSNKDYSKTKSIIFPLIFNFLGFAYTITKIEDAKNKVIKYVPQGNEAPVTDEPNKEQKFHHHLQWLLKYLDELSDEIPLENQLNKNEKITVNLENWLGTVSFKTTREKLYQLKVYLKEEFDSELFTPDYESISWEELRINNEFIINGNVGITGCCDPYLIFEPKGQFLAVDRWDINGSWDHSGDGYSFEFFNCKAPAKLEKYLFNEWMFFGHSNRALTKENDLKTMKSAYKDTEDGGAYVSNDGSAIIRLQDFDIDKFLSQLWFNREPVMKNYGRWASDLTPEMIDWVKNETIPRLKQEYGITSREEYHKHWRAGYGVTASIQKTSSDADLDAIMKARDAQVVVLISELKPLVRSCSFPEFNEDEWDVDEEQVILNSVFKWLISEDWKYKEEE